MLPHEPHAIFVSLFYLLQGGGDVLTKGTLKLGEFGNRDWSRVQPFSGRRREIDFVHLMGKRACWCRCCGDRLRRGTMDEATRAGVGAAATASSCFTRALSRCSSRLFSIETTTMTMTPTSVAIMATSPSFEVVAPELEVARISSDVITSILFVVS